MGAEEYHEKPRLLAGYHTYWRGLPMDDRFETYVRPLRGFPAWPTKDDLTLLTVGQPLAEFDANKKDIETNYRRTLDLAPAFAGRDRAARRGSRFVSTAVRDYFRKPFGPGWALVADAGYNRDFITARGISPFREAENCADALDQAFSGESPFDVAMAYNQSRRDAHSLPLYEFTAQLATLEPLPPSRQQSLRAMRSSQEAMTQFARVDVGVTSPLEFFSEENVRCILAAAG